MRASRRSGAALTLRSVLRFSVLANRWIIMAFLFAAAFSLYALALIAPEAPAARWLVLEGFFIPFGVLLTADAFTGRYRNSQLEVLLARQPARKLFTLLAGSRMLLLLLLGLGMSLRMTEAGMVPAAARMLLLLGATHALINLTRSVWPGLALLGIWWFMGLFLRVPWSAAAPALAIWHPMRLGGGGEVRPGLEVITLVIGAALLAAAWFAVGRARRWLS
jgi:hypothetical protein